MKTLEKLTLAGLRQIDPETAHKLGLKAVQMGLSRSRRTFSTPRIKTQIAGLSLPNPIGLAAGFDKNAEALRGLSRSGFGFLEVGAATPYAQEGNPRPRLYRLPQDRGVINRFGFNNQGMEEINKRLKWRPRDTILGLNLGANKESADRSADFARVLAYCGENLDFATVNVSSPNTEKLRELQGKSALTSLLQGVLEARDTLHRPIPVFLKIAPDLNEGEIGDIAEIALDLRLDGIVATNTTLERENLISEHKSQSGGLSGAPLFEKSTRILAKLSELTTGQIPLIGVGGVASAQDAYDKICAGASAVQLYTALIYHGLSLVEDIARGLDQFLARDGFDTISQAIGCKRDHWL